MCYYLSLHVLFLSGFPTPDFWWILGLFPNLCRLFVFVGWIWLGLWLLLLEVVRSLICCPGFVPAFGFFPRFFTGLRFLFPGLFLDFDFLYRIIPGFSPDFERNWDGLRKFERNWEKLKEIERNWEKLRIKSGAHLGFCVFSLWIGIRSFPKSPNRIPNKSPRFPDVAPCPPKNPSKVLPWPRGNFMMRDPVLQKSLTHAALVQRKFCVSCPRKIHKNVARAQENVYEASSCPWPAP